MFGSLGFTELILILVIVLIIFGAGKLPQLGEGVGKAIKGFKKSVHEAEAFDADPQAAQGEAPTTESAPPQLNQPVHTVSEPAPANPQVVTNPVPTQEPVATSTKA